MARRCEGRVSWFVIVVRWLLEIGRKGQQVCDNIGQQRWENNNEFVIITIFMREEGQWCVCGMVGHIRVVQSCEVMAKLIDSSSVGGGEGGNWFWFLTKCFFLLLCLTFFYFFFILLMNFFCSLLPPIQFLNNFPLTIWFIYSLLFTYLFISLYPPISLSSYLYISLSYS